MLKSMLKAQMKALFNEDLKKVYFTISYLWSIALDYFEPYINEPNPLQSFDFLED